MVGDRTESQPWWRRLWSGNARTRLRRETAFEAYRQIVARARRPVLYREWNVPDTHDGRFEAVGLHAMLVMRRLRHAGPEGGALAQEIFNVMFEDMDGSVREQGVGDLKVGKYIKRMASSFLARAREVDESIEQGDTEGLSTKLRRYFYGTSTEAPTMRDLAEDLLHAESWLRDVSDADLLEGKFEPALAEAAKRQNHRPAQNR